MSKIMADGGKILVNTSGALATDCGECTCTYCTNKKPSSYTITISGMPDKGCRIYENGHWYTSNWQSYNGVWTVPCYSNCTWRTSFNPPIADPARHYIKLEFQPDKTPVITLETKAGIYPYNGVFGIWIGNTNCDLINSSYSMYDFGGFYVWTCGPDTSSAATQVINSSISVS